MSPTTRNIPITFKIQISLHITRIPWYWETFLFRVTFLSMRLSSVASEWSAKPFEWVGGCTTILFYTKNLVSISCTRWISNSVKKSFSVTWISQTQNSGPAGAFLPKVPIMPVRFRTLGDRRVSKVTGLIRPMSAIKIKDDTRVFLNLKEAGPTYYIPVCSKSRHCALAMSTENSVAIKRA